MEPVLLKSLKLLRNTQESLTGKDIAEKTEEDRVYVDKALGKLTERKVITKNGEFYRYQKTLINEEFLKRMLAVYDKISQKQICDRVTVGLLSTATQYKYLLSQNTLLRVMEEEGFDSKDINNFLEEEIKTGRIGKLKVAIISKKEGLPPVPPALSFYHISLMSFDSTGYCHMDMRELECYQYVNDKGEVRD